jgi:hypothetical protein
MENVFFTPHTPSLKKRENATSCNLDFNENLKGKESFKGKRIKYMKCAQELCEISQCVCETRAWRILQSFVNEFVRKKRITFKESLMSEYARASERMNGRKDFSPNRETHTPHIEI